MPSLLDMTGVPMTNILEKSSLESILTLRKVCHSLRNFIDDSCFKTDLDDMLIRIRPNGFSAEWQITNTIWPDGMTFTKDLTSSDLKIILKMIQNTKLSCFYVINYICNLGYLDDLEDILKNQTRPLQTERFKIEGPEAMKILPYLISKTLKEISISTANNGTDDQFLDATEQFCELEQFKNAVKLTIDDCFLVRADLRKFLHFQRVHVKLRETSLEELEALKEAFVTSTDMEYFVLDGLRLNENQLEQVFGTPFYDPLYELDSSQWFFKIQNCKDYVLRIECSWRGLQFWKWVAKDVPQGAVGQH